MNPAAPVTTIRMGGKQSVREEPEASVFPVMGFRERSWSEDGVEVVSREARMPAEDSDEEVEDS
jgi:hypothetical protein